MQIAHIIKEQNCGIVYLRKPRNQNQYICIKNRLINCIVRSKKTSTCSVFQQFNYLKVQCLNLVLYCNNKTEFPDYVYSI